MVLLCSRIELSADEREKAVWRVVAEAFLVAFYGASNIAFIAVSSMFNASTISFRNIKLHVISYS